MDGWMDGWMDGLLPIIFGNEFEEADYIRMFHQTDDNNTRRKIYEIRISRDTTQSIILNNK